MLRGETDEHRDAAFCEGGRLHGETHCMELESGSDPDGMYWPRIRWQHLEGPEHSKAVMCRTRTHKYVYRLYEMDELYDLVADPLEEHNVVEDGAYRDVLATLKERLLRWYLETCDVVPRATDRR